MHLIQSFFRRIMKDLRQKKLIPLKILFFVHASTLFVLYPYLTIHMRELGINVEETAIMSAVSPVIFIVMPPLAGMLADKVGNFRLLLALSSVMGGLSALLLLTVPVGRITVTYPPVTEMLVTCEDGTMRLQHLYEHACQPLHPYPYNINLTILSCGLLCEFPDYLSQEETNTMLHTQSYDVNLRAPDGKQLVYRHTISPFLMRPNELTKDQKLVRTLTNNPFFDTSASKISDTAIFIPIPQIYKVECTNNSRNATCFFGNQDVLSEHISKEATKFLATISHELQEKSEDAKSFSIKVLSMGNLTVFDDDFKNSSISCSNETNLEANVHAGSRKMSQCSMACAAITPRKNLCLNLKQQIEFDPVFTFWTYLAVRVFIGIISGTAFAMFEGAVIAILREQSADYGLQRMYGSIGGMISSPLSGLLIDYASRGKGYTDFRPAFYLYAVLKVASGVLMLSIDLEFKQPAQNLIADVISVLKNIELMALFIACFIMGTAWGYIESFLFWLLQDMGASRSLMGVTITVGGIAGLPLLVLSGPIIKKLGHANVIFIGFVFYAIRLLGYSLIYNPWLCLIFEALESVTSSLSFTAAVTYAARLSSTTTDTSVQGMLGGIYYGVGKGSGSLIGGYMMKFFGTRPTYQIFAAATLITGCVYILFNQLFIRKRAMDDSNDICKKKPAVLNIESHEANKEKDKSGVPIEDAKNDVSLERIVNGNVSLSDENQQKVTVDNIDGGSDSGVENLAYNDTENSDINVTNKKSNNPSGQ